MRVKPPAQNDNPSCRIHAIPFMIYGIAVGAIYASILFFILRTSPLIGGICGAGVITLLGFWGWGLSHDETMPIWRRLVMLLLIPLALPGTVIGIIVFLLLAGCISLYMLPSQLWRERQFRRYLRQNGRLIEMPELEVRLRGGEGTLLEECGPKGAQRIWWTPDDLASKEPTMEAKERLIALFTGDDNSNYNAARQFNALCLTEYLGRDGGKASLTTLSAGHAKSGKLARRFPQARRVIVVPPPFWWRENRVSP